MERFEKDLPQTRNIERDKSSFLERISADLVVEIPAQFDKISTQNLLVNLEHSKVLILGEIHGVKENVDIIYTFFKRFRFRQLALEWEPNLLEVAQNYLETSELDFDALKDSPDGRITAGHFSLLKKLKSEGLLDKLICFDGGATGPGWNSRDDAMARNIVANLSGVSTLVVAGNLHAKVESFSVDAEQLHPMGQRVKEEIPGVSSGVIKYGSGKFYNYGTREFKQQEGEAEISSVAHFYQKEDGVYVFELPKASAATVPNPHERI